MRRHNQMKISFALAIVLVAIVSSIEPGAAEPAPSQPARSPAEPSPLQDDANLNDVQFVGSKIGWAVGDRGVIWTTGDGGRTWRFVPSAVSCPLRSVCFLTDRVGWIAGGGTAPYTRVGYGVVIFTNDAGATWQELGKDALPVLHSVKFFDLQKGVAVGAATADHPTGIFLTQDGGRTWESVPGPRSDGWRTAYFPTPEIGVVAGSNNRVSLVGEGRLFQPKFDVFGLRGIHKVAGTPRVPSASVAGTLRVPSAEAHPPTPAASGRGEMGASRTRSDTATDEHLWLVGDGGLVLTTDNGGVAWQAPPTPLPADLRDLLDFRAVAVRGSKVWLAGEPGSIIWHTPDGGRTWTKQLTRQTVPIHALEFTSDSTGWAVGALGMILWTGDGGQTWQPVRGADRRSALMVLAARASRVSFPLLVKQSRELGYRSVVVLPARRDLGPESHTGRDLDLRLHEAVNAAGGSAGEVDWQFPVVIPGLERNQERLIADWNRRTEGRLRDVFLGKLVCRLRTWRPSVIVIDQPAADDATTRLLNDALLHAVEQAADPTRFIQHQELAGLEPWQVRKVYERLPAGSTGQTHIDLHEYLPRLGTSVQAASADAASRFDTAAEATSGREAYRLLRDAGPRRVGFQPARQERTDGSDSSGNFNGQTGSLPYEKADGTRSVSATFLGGDFFTGVSLSPGSAARRVLKELDEEQAAAGEKLAQRQRNFRAYAERFLGDPRHAGQVIAELNQITAGMPDEQAALQLEQLANDYRRSSRWDLAEAALVELVERYPDQPVAHEAMRWLLQFWTGMEPAWQRVRAVQVDRQQLQSSVGNVEAMRERVLRATQLAQVPPDEREETLPDLSPDPIKLVNAAGTLKIDSQADWRTGAVRHWHEQAVRMASLMRKKSPGLYRTPEVQFSVATLLRQRGAYELADNFYRRFDRVAGSEQSDGPAVLPPGLRKASDPATPLHGVDSWKATAASELWLLAPNSGPPKELVICRRVAERPYLDGLLSDPCWQGATPIRLRVDAEQGGVGGNSAIVFLAYDAEYLYVAASVPRVPGSPADPPQLAGRTHDADLSKFDHLSLYLDLDRDYATYYAFHIDQRGWTAESCWEDASWDPQWHVAAAADETHWRIEAAIPLNALTPHPPARNSVWAVGIVRTVPAIALESWTHPALSPPRPETFGLVRFD